MKGYKRSCATMMVLLLILFPLTQVVIVEDSAAETSNVYCLPQITVIFVSEYGSLSGYLLGKVTGVNTSLYEIHAYLVVHDVLWTKPYYTMPATALDVNGEFQLDITTGGQDRCATAVYLYLVPKDTEPTICSPCYEPPDMEEAIASLVVDRSPLQRTIAFSNNIWLVKGSPCAQGPGPNVFDPSSESVWVDCSGYLHLKVRNDNGTFTSSEVINENYTGFGSYVAVIKGRVDLLDRLLVFAFFLWDYTGNYIYFREMDIEFSFWDNLVTDTIGQFVVQPCGQCPGCSNCVRFPVELSDQEDELTLYMIWQQDKIEFRAYKGDYSNSLPPASALVHAWIKTEGIPDEGNVATHFNFWQFMGKDPSNGLSSEMIVKFYDYQQEIISFPGCVEGCDDSNECTIDICDPIVGCLNTPNEDTCDDQNRCTINDVCANGVCTSTTAADCDDGNECTTDSCSPNQGCVKTPNSNQCDDGNACTSSDTCTGGNCYGQAITCDDANICTDDSCSYSTGCAYTANNDLCDDGDECTSNDVCQNGVCTGTLFVCGECGVEITKALGGYVYGNANYCDPDLHGVAVYIKVRGGWWTKPYWSMPVTDIADDRTWRCDIVTGGVDTEATDVCAFLIKDGYVPPLRGNQSTLPQELYDNAIDYECVGIPFGE